MTYEDKLAYLFSLKSETITATDIFRLFNKKFVPGYNGGEPTISPPMFFPVDKITVKAGQLPSIKHDIVTTVGRYIFNLVVISYAFGDKVPYVDETLRSKNIDKLQNYLSDELLMGRITGEEFGKFQTRLVWMNNFVEILVPGTSPNLMVLPDEIKKKLQELIDANKECIIKGDTTAYINNVENPIIEFARNFYIKTNDPGWMLYAKGGKPDFKNSFKNMFLEVGPILDIATGKYKISTSCFSEGLPPEENYLYANNGIYGSYSRSVQTQFGGAKTKEFAVAFQSQVVTEDDCGSQLTIGIDVTKDNLDIIKWRYIRDEQNSTRFILVDPDNINFFIGKHVEYRSPMLCMTENGYCWKCVGDLYKRMGLKNVGLANQKLTSTFLNSALKKFHNTSQKTTNIDWKNCFYSV